MLISHLKTNGHDCDRCPSEYKPQVPSKIPRKTMWGDEEECQTPCYVMAKDVKGRPTVVVLSPHERGWKTRSPRRPEFTHDYVSHETVADVLHWLKHVDGLREVTVSEYPFQALEFLSQTEFRAEETLRVLESGV